MQEKIWEYRNKQLKNEDILALSKRLSLPYVVTTLLMNRGLFTDSQINAYRKKSLDSVYSPFCFCDMENATERIISAISAKEKIIIYGDYDVDGITSTSALYLFLKSQNADVDYYIPDRFTEGYGLNIMAINRLSKQGYSLMITVDCGITSVGEISFAKTQGLDVIVTDHHTPKEEIPKALAVLNPKVEDSGYPFSGLAGVGVTFKLILGLAKALGLSTKDVFFKYVDLAALGTIADVVPLMDENRVIVDKGIAAIENTNNIGIKALLRASGIADRAKDTTSIAFSLAPRLNVAGRLENAKLSVELLTCTDEQKAQEIAEHLCDLNHKRQQIEQEIYLEALEMLKTQPVDQYVYVLSGKNWHHGVIGIVASRLAEKLYRPVIMISCENGKGKASCRSIEEFNLFDALTACEDTLTAFGGHSQAAGLSIEENKIDEFRKQINEYAKKELEGLTLSPKVKIDCELSPSALTLGGAKTLESFEPYGAGNELPVFSASNLKVTAISAIGADKKHLRMSLSANGGYFLAVGFNMAEYTEKIATGDIVKIAFNMSVNTYQGNENLQLILKDIKK